MKGRLGNQLFIYATLRNIGIIKKYQINYSKNLMHHGQKCLLDYFNLYPSNPTGPAINIYHQKNVRGSLSKGYGSCYYDINILNIPDNIKIHGHFINEKYFYENREIIKDELQIKEPINTLCQNYLDNIKANKYTIIGIHFRRGDAIREKSEEGTFNEQTSINFVEKALAIISVKENNIKLLCFVGGWRGNQETNPSPIKNTQDNDIAWLKDILQSKFNKYDAIISPGTIQNDVLTDYGFLSKCDYNIIPNISTFSWMAAYINKNNDNKVYVNKDDCLVPAQKFITL